MSCGGSRSNEGKSRKIIIPKGSIRPNETVVIEIPSRLRNNSTVLARRRSTSSPGSFGTPSIDQQPLAASTPSPMVSRIGTPQCVSEPRPPQNSSYAPVNQTFPTYGSIPPENQSAQVYASGSSGNYVGIPEEDQFMLNHSTSSHRHNTEFHSLGGTPRRGLSLLGDTTLHSLDGTIRRGSSLLGDTTLHSLNGTPTRNTCTCNDLDFAGETFYSLCGTPIRGSSLLGDTTLHSLGGTPTRNTCTCNDLEFAGETFYSLCGTPIRGSSLLGDTTLHSLGGTPTRNTCTCTDLYLTDPTSLYSLSGFPRRGASLINGATLYSLGDTPARGSSLYGGAPVNATYNPNSPLIRCRYKADMSFEPQYASTPNKVGCDPCDNRNLSAPVNPVTAPGRFRTNETYGGGPIQSGRPINTFEHHVSVGPQMSRIERNTPRNNCSTLDSRSGTYDSSLLDNDESGSMDTSLLGRVIGGDIPRRMVWPTPASQRTPKVMPNPYVVRNKEAVRANLFNVQPGEGSGGNATYNADGAYQGYNSDGSNWGNETYDADNSDQGNCTNSECPGSSNPGNATYNQRNATYNQGNATYNQGNATYNQGNATYNQGNATDNRGNSTYNRGNASYNRGNSTRTGQGTPQCPGANATYDNNVPSNQSPFIRRTENYEQPFNPQIASTPIRAESAPCGQRNRSAPVPGVASPQSNFGHLHLNESYSGHPSNFVPQNYPFQVPAQQMSRIPQYSLGQSINSNCSMESFTQETSENFESSGSMDTSLLGRVIAGDIGRVLVWPTPPSQRVPSEGNRTFDASNRDSSDAEMAYDADNSDRGNCTNSECPGSSNQGNATYNQGNATYNQGNAADNRGNSTYNRGNASYNRGNSTRTGQGTPQCPGANATYNNNVPSNQSPFIRRTGNYEQPFNPQIASTPIRAESAPCGQRNRSAPVPGVASPQSNFGHLHLNESYSGHPSNFVPQNYPFQVPAQQMSRIPQYSLGQSINSNCSMESFTQETSENFESSGSMDTSLLGRVIAGDIGRVLVWPTPPSQRVPSEGNRTFDASNRSYCSSSNSHECSGDTYDSSDAEMAASKASGYPNATYLAPRSASPSGQNLTYAKNVSFGARGNNMTYNNSPNERENCECNSSSSSSKFGNFAPNANSTTIAEQLGNRTYQKSPSRTRSGPDGNNCGCITTGGEGAIGLNRMEAAETTILQENLRNWQETRRRLLEDATMLTPSSTSTENKDENCGCK